MCHTGFFLFFLYIYMYNNNCSTVIHASVSYLSVDPMCRYIPCLTTNIIGACDFKLFQHCYYGLYCILYIVIK